MTGLGIEIEESRIKYFSDCNLVVRAPGSFFLSGEFSVEIGQPALLLVTDFWVYIGLKPKHGGDTDIEMLEIDPSAPLFKSEEIDNISDYYKPNSKLGSQLQTSLDALGDAIRKWRSKTKNVPHFDLKIWSDVPCATGMGTMGAISACMAILFYYLETPDLNPMKLNSILRIFSREEYPGLLRKNPAFERVFALSRWLHDTMSNYSSSGAATFASLVRTDKSRQIIVYFIQEREVKDTTAIREPLTDHTMYITRLQELRWYGAKLKMRQWLEKTYGMTIVYCGARSIPDHTTGLMADWHKFASGEFSKNLMEELKLKGPASFDRMLAFPLNYLLQNMASGRTSEQNKSNYWPHSAFCAALGTITCNMIDAILTKGHNADRFKDLIVDNRRMLLTYGILKDPLRSFDGNLRKAIQKNVSGNQGTVVCFTKSIGTGNGGSIILFAEATDLNAINEYLWGLFNPKRVKNAVAGETKAARKAREKAEEKAVEEAKKAREALGIKTGAQIYCSSIGNSSYIPSDLDPVYLPEAGTIEFKGKRNFKIPGKASDGKIRSITIIKGKSGNFVKYTAEDGSKHKFKIEDDQDNRLIDLLVLAAKYKIPVSYRTIYDVCVEKPNDSQLGINASVREHKEDKIVKEVHKYMTSFRRRMNQRAEKESENINLFNSSRLVKVEALPEPKSQKKSDARGYLLNSEFVEFKDSSSGDSIPQRIKKAFATTGDEASKFGSTDDAEGNIARKKNTKNQ